MKNLKFKSIDIVDISAIERSLWQPRLEEADVLFFEGGGTFHLMEWMHKSGLAEILPELLKARVYVGVSAGSMVTGKDLILRTSQVLYEEDFDRFADMKCLGLVDFYIVPHFNSPYFKKIREENIREIIGGMRNMPMTYVLDDNSALRVVDGRVEVVSEGRWFVING